MLAGAVRPERKRDSQRGHFRLAGRFRDAVLRARLTGGLRRALVRRALVFAALFTAFFGAFFFTDRRFGLRADACLPALRVVFGATGFPAPSVSLRRFSTTAISESKDFANDATPSISSFFVTSSMVIPTSA